LAGIKSLSLPAFAGIRNDRPLAQFDASDLAVATNVDLMDGGQVRRREGFISTLASAGAHSLWSNGAVCLYASGANLLRLALPLNAGTTIASGLTANAPLAYTQAAGRIYWSNGDQSGVVDAHAIANRGWGIVPPPMPTALPTVGELPPGRYGITTTYVADDGQESGAPEAALVDLPDGGGIDLYLTPSEDARIVSQRIYLTTPNGEVLYHAGTLAADVTNVIVSLNTIDLQTPLQTLLMGPCPHGKLIAHYRGRMYVAKGRYVFYSEPFALELFDLRRYLEFPRDVRMLAPVTDGIFISDEEAVYWMSGAGPNEFNASAVADTNPAIRGMPAYAAIDDLFPDTPSSSEQMAALWLSTAGPAAGLPGGTVRVLNDKWRFNAPGSVAQAFYKRPSRPYQYLASFLGE
jgi:hypothetical protein